MRTLTLSTSLFLALFLVAVSWAGDDGGITYCGEGKFADCTEALNCAQSDVTSPDGEKVLECQCKAREATSVTAGACMDATSTKLQSRYPGVSAMGVCTGEANVWADCLGVPCDAADTEGNSTCFCVATTSQPLASTQYVIVGVGEAAAQEVCKTDVYNSSATPGQVFDATAVLREGMPADGSSPPIIDPAISWVLPASMDGQ